MWSRWLGASQVIVLGEMTAMERGGTATYCVKEDSPLVPPQLQAACLPSFFTAMEMCWRPRHVSHSACSMFVYSKIKTTLSSSLFLIVRNNSFKL